VIEGSFLHSFCQIILHVIFNCHSQPKTTLDKLGIFIVNSLYFIIFVKTKQAGTECLLQVCYCLKFDSHNKMV